MSALVVFATSSELDGAPGWWLAIGAIYLVALLAAGVVSALKGKWGMVVLGLLFHWAWVFAAIRLAKPRSVYARRFYRSHKLRRAAMRFGDEQLLASVPAAGSTATAEATKRCPDCAETILAAAKVCRFCGYRLLQREAEPALAEPSVAPATPRARPPSQLPPRSAAPVRRARTTFAIVAVVLALSVVGALIWASSNSDADPVGEADAATSSPAPAANPSTAKPAARRQSDSSWQTVSYDYTRRLGVAAFHSKRLRLVMPQAGLFIGATVAPAPEVTVRVNGRVRKAGTAPNLAPHTRFWAIPSSRMARVEVTIRNRSDSTRVYKVTVYEVDPTLIDGTWDQTPGLPGGPNNPGSAEYRKTPDGQSITIYSETSQTNFMAQSFTARGVSDFTLYPGLTRFSCFVIALSGDRIGSSRISFGHHRSVGSIGVASRSGSEIRLVGKFNGEWLAPRIEFSVNSPRPTKARMEYDTC